MKKSFNQYTDSELLTLDNVTINDAIRLEAIERGISPPMPLSEALHSSEWKGFIRPADTVAVFELVASNQYGSPHHSGVVYLDEARAAAALDGIAYMEENRYGNGGPKLFTGAASLRKVLIGEHPAASKAIKFQEYCQDDTAFNKVSEECLARLSAVSQTDYDKRVNAEKRAEYLRLASGNEEIAKSFWAKVEKTAWPETAVPA